MSSTQLSSATLDAKQIRAEIDIRDADPSLPPTCVWPARVELESIVFPDSPRFYVQRWQSMDISWISPNCPAAGMPEPPSLDGPLACGCLNSSGHPEAIYGHMEAERLWPCRADWYDESKPERTFVPDIWAGLGPCPSVGMASVLHRFPAYVKEARAGRFWFRIEDAARRDMESAESVDAEFLPWLFPEDGSKRPPTVPRLVFEGASSAELLHARWSVWALHVLKKRAFVCHKMVAAHSARAALASNEVGFDRMKKAAYFGQNSVGAWFNNTLEQVGVIRQLISLGVPVFYRWELRFADKQKLADLRPCRAPEEESARYQPPMSPSRAGQASGPARESTQIAVVAQKLFSEPVDPERHWHSSRRFPPDAIDEFGHPLLVDKRTLDWIEEQEAKQEALQAARSSPAPSSHVSRGQASAAGAPPSSAAPSSRSSSQAPVNIARPAWSHAALADSNRIPLQRRIASAATGVDWFYIPNVLDYFAQKDDYRLNAEGLPKAGGYADDAEWRAKLVYPYWVPEQYKARLTARQSNDKELVEMAVRYGCGFRTVIPQSESRAASEPSPVGGFSTKGDYFRAHNHQTVAELRLVEDHATNYYVENWALSVRLICGERDHGRAALAAGGLIARIARWSGLGVQDALKGPSQGLRDWGTRSPIEERSAGGSVWCMDDWLDATEIHTLQGLLHCPSGKVLTLWPDPEQFKNNWFDERGTWTLAMELWFVDRLEQLWAKRENPDFKTCAQWREEIRGCKREEDATLDRQG
ncbi:hypothetical protein AURDEDRAFT_161456 [Auricularia subglabra TFB-10046 SS5]|nr:hypothetical protein AURDEDRAFT_161456 [Auricularia subglabra TFB-10046 SS5]